VGPAGAPVQRLAQPEVRKHQVARAVYQDVLQLHVAVDYVALVQVVEGDEELRHVEARGGVLEGALVRQVEEHLAAGHEVQHQVQAAPRLERVVQVGRERHVPDLL